MTTRFFFSMENPTLVSGYPLRPPRVIFPPPIFFLPASFTFYGRGVGLGGLGWCRVHSSLYEQARWRNCSFSLVRSPRVTETDSTSETSGPALQAFFLFSLLFFHFVLLFTFSEQSFWVPPLEDGFSSSTIFRGKFSLLPRSSPRALLQFYSFAKADLGPSPIGKSPAAPLFTLNLSLSLF